MKFSKMDPPFPNEKDNTRIRMYTNDFYRGNSILQKRKTNQFMYYKVDDVS